MNGLLVVNKQKDWTSRDVVNKLVSILETKQIGHIGTLDPLASGVLVCLIGKYTKLSNLLIEHDKEYIAKFKLGILTDTLDITGKILKKKVNNITKEELEKVINNFPKEYIQEVPKYSAVKIKGKKLYEYARNNIEVELPKRVVKIYNLELLDYKNDEVTIKCFVSKGTYIRSLINDIANMLNTFGTMTELTRTQLGNFKLQNAYNLNEIKNNEYKLLKLEDFLDIKTIDLKETELNKIKNGNKVFDNINKFVLYKYNNENIALYYRFNKEELKPLIMF